MKKNFLLGLMKLRFISLNVLLVLFIMSCDDNFSEKENPCKVSEYVSNQHIDMIKKVGKLYEESFVEVTNSKVIVKSSSDSTDPNDYVVKLFNKKLEEAFPDNQYLTRGGSSSSDINVISEVLLQGYMDKFSDKLLEIIANDDSILEKEDVLNQVLQTRDNFLDEISKKENLKDIEKTVLMENVLLSSELILVRIKCVDNEVVQTKGLRDWFERNKAKIACVVATASAVVSCASIIGGNWVAWLKCGSSTLGAISCWENL